MKLAIVVSLLSFSVWSQSYAPYQNVGQATYGQLKQDDAEDSKEGDIDSSTQIINDQQASYAAVNQGPANPSGLNLPSATSEELHGSKRLKFGLKFHAGEFGGKPQFSQGHLDKVEGEYGIGTSLEAEAFGKKVKILSAEWLGKAEADRTKKETDFTGKSRVVISMFGLTITQKQIVSYENARDEEDEKKGYVNVKSDEWKKEFEKPEHKKNEHKHSGTKSFFAQKPSIPLAGIISLKFDAGTNWKYGAHTSPKLSGFKEIGVKTLLESNFGGYVEGYIDALIARAGVKAQVDAIGGGFGLNFKVKPKDKEFLLGGLGNAHFMKGKMKLFVEVAKPKCCFKRGWGKLLSEDYEGKVITKDMFKPIMHKKL